MKNTLTPIVENMIKAVKPNMVYCRDYKIKKSYLRKIIPGGSLAFKALTFLYIKSKGMLFFSSLQTKLIIFFLKRAKDTNPLAIYHYSSFKEVLSTRKNQITINIAASVNTPAVLNSINEEYKKYGETYDTTFFSYFNRGIQSSDYIIAYSKFVKDELAKDGFPKNKIYFCPNIIDLTKIQPKKKYNDQKFIAVCVADFNLNKGIQYVIEAWNELKLENAEFWLVGHKNKHIQALLKKSDDSIKDIGHTDVSTLYAKASVFVLGSLSEGSARVTFEAMLAGIPAIVTHNSGSPVTHGVDGFIGPIKDSEFFKEKLTYYYNNPKKLKEHGQKARKNILNNYNNVAFRKRFDSIIKNIAKKENLTL